MKQICMLASFLFALAGCEDFNDEILPSGGMISFQEQDIWGTKGTPATLENHKEFVVYAHSFDATGAKPGFSANFMDNVSVTKNASGDWTYSPLMYWPADPEEVEFMAYSPKATSSNGLSAVKITKNGAFSVTYTVPTDITNQPDLMFASTLPLSNVEVDLSFEHLLTKVSFSVKGNPDKRIKSITLNKIKSKGVYSSMTDKWTYKPNINHLTAPFTVSLANSDLLNVVPDTTSQNITKQDAYLFMLPQTLNKGSQVFISISDANGSKVTKDTLTFASDQVWKAGDSYNYCIEIPSVEVPEGTILDVKGVEKYFDGTWGNYPEGDTWVITDTVPDNDVNWWRFNFVVLQAALDGVDVKLVFPNLTTLGSGTFDKSFISSFSAPNLTEIPELFFQNCPKLTQVELTGVKEIGKDAFINCPSLETVRLDSAESIGKKAFQGCSSLTSINFPNAKDISESAFYQCLSLDTVNLPKAESIGPKAFQECESLTTVILPRVKNIGTSAFEYCPKLATMELATDTDVELESVAKIYEWNKNTVDLTIGSDNAGFITTNNSNPALKVGDGAINPFKSIKMEPN